MTAPPVLTPVQQTSPYVLKPTGSYNLVTTTSVPYGVYLEGALSSSQWTSGAVAQVAFTYKMLGGDSTWPCSETNDDRKDTTTILQGCGIMTDEFQYGRTKIFLRQPMTLFLLEEQRERRLHDIANIINSCYRRYVQILKN